MKRDEVIQQKLRRDPIVGVRKMSDDEGEKFYLNYWVFLPPSSHSHPLQDQNEHENSKEDGLISWANVTVAEMASPPFLLHSAHTNIMASNVLSRFFRFPIAPRSVVDKRDFQCPSRTSSCISINRPSSCCAEGQTCQLIEDTGLGDVGCCAAGETCAGSLSQCASGYTSCPDYPGGGCCIAGYACVSGGCLLSSTATVFVSPSPPSAPSSSATQNPSITSIATPPTRSSGPTPSSSQGPTTTIATITSASTLSGTLACSSGFRSCPASLGGGCCSTDRACGRDICPEQSSTGTVAAPVRPTSANPPPPDASATGCPTGFYACSAFYQGGCCRFGRDCAPTSCPSDAATTLIDDNSVTIIAPPSRGLSANSILTGACATGWSTCAASDGGGCCPIGYVCGNSCTATATGSGLTASQIGKLAPNGAAHGVAVTRLAIIMALVVVLCLVA